jgi:hypothetical protein
MTEEIIRGIRFNLKDVTLHVDAIHRGGSQLIPTVRRNLYACELTANSRFVELIFLVEIQTPHDAVRGIYQCMFQLRCIVISEEPVQGTPLVIIKSYLPLIPSVSPKPSEPQLLFMSSANACLTIGSCSTVIYSKLAPRVLRCIGYSQGSQAKYPSS